jgi:hypothetical protein
MTSPAGKGATVTVVSAGWYSESTRRTATFPAAMLVKVAGAVRPVGSPAMKIAAPGGVYNEANKMGGASQAR